MSARYVLESHDTVYEITEVTGCPSRWHRVVPRAGRHKLGFVHHKGKKKKKLFMHLGRDKR